MTAVPPSGQKRQQDTTEQQSTASATLSQPRWKRAKTPFKSRKEANTAYWDSLSKLWLTRRALRELDRRNRQTANSVRTRITSRPNLSGELASENRSSEIKRFARHGGPDLQDLRGVSLTRVIFRPLLIRSLQYPEFVTANSTAHVMPSNQSSSRTKSKARSNLGDSATSKTKKTSAYDPNFEQILIDNHTYPDNHDFPDGRDPPRPNNENEILDRLKQTRPSLSPSLFSDKAFRSFGRINAQALHEDDVMASVIPLIQGDASIPSARNLSFGNLEPFADGKICDAKPDFYDGARPEEINQQVRTELGLYITPSTQQRAPALPNFFMEVKGPDGSGAVAKRQACYDGAVGARGIHQLRSFRVEDLGTVYDNNAYTITSAYHSATGTLQVYTTHPTQPTVPEESPKYHMTQLRSFAMTDTAEAFRQGASAFRNARDWAKENRDELIVAANVRVKSMLSESSATEEISVLDTSADELALGTSEGPNSSHRPLKRKRYTGTIATPPNLDRLSKHHKKRGNDSLRVSQERKAVARGRN